MQCDDIYIPYSIISVSDTECNMYALKIDFKNQDEEFIIDDIILIVRYSMQSILFMVKLLRQSRQSKAIRSSIRIQRIELDNSCDEIKANTNSIIRAMSET